MSSQSDWVQSPAKMSPAEVLGCVRDILGTERTWCQGAMARARDGRKVQYTDPAARQFSLDGALFRVQHITKAPIQQAHHCLLRAIHPRGEVPLPSFNDAEGLSHAALQRTIEKALKFAEAL